MPRSVQNANRPIPALTREAAILHECRPLSAHRLQLEQMAQRDVADPEQSRVAGVALANHRRPRLGVLLAPAVAGRRPVEHVAVHVLGSKVLERAGHRLLDLGGQRRGRVVRQAVILTALIREFGLHEHVGARHDPRRDGRAERLADADLHVMPPLVRRVDAAESAAQRELGERGGAILFPRRAVEKRGNAGGRHYRTEARGATETPRAPVRSMARATRPEAFASSTKPRR